MIRKSLTVPLSLTLFLTLLVTLLFSCATQKPRVAFDQQQKLQNLKSEWQKAWPANRTINLVFHGHSVPAGYFKTPEVRSLESYPYQVLAKLKAQYPLAVINVIVTAIGGENSVAGARRFQQDVLTHHPDLLFIDYALNDASLPLDQTQKTWSQMIVQAKQQGIPVVLLTPSPDMRVPITDTASPLNQHRLQIIELAKTHSVSVVDSYQLFIDQLQQHIPVEEFMSQVNHPNQRGHELIANGIMELLK